MKKLFFLSSVVMGFVALFAINSNNSKASAITLANLLAISSAQAEGTDITGPV